MSCQVYSKLIIPEGLGFGIDCVQEPSRGAWPCGFRQPSHFTHKMPHQKGVLLAGFPINLCDYCLEAHFGIPKRIVEFLY